ncbi:MAG: hypothetical protein J7K54_02125 [Candidatus Aenigmarchaeota archaeon]|nr:hypothetical protein [Candidatus Aenigmarchaeota archaeon]
MGVLPVRIEDVTAVANLMTAIPIEKLVTSEENTEYESEESQGVVYRVREPKATALIFPSGRIVCTGPKSIQDARKAIGVVLEKLRSVGVSIDSEPEIDIERIVAAFRMDKPFDLDAVSQALEGAEKASGGIEGVVYMDEEHNADFLILPEGKIICTGSDSIKNIQAAVRELKNKLDGAGIKADFVED